jgi:hypothetical protein
MISLDLRFALISLDCDSSLALPSSRRGVPCEVVR